MIRGAAATGIVNLVAAAVVAVFLLRHVVSLRQLVTALCALAAALALLATLLVRARDIETTSRQRLYADPIIAYRHTAYQEIVVTRRGNDTRLYLDGGLQFSTRDEYRYTESLVYPALGHGAHSVLVLGGGDGLAARELLRQTGMQQDRAGRAGLRGHRTWPAPRCGKPTAVRWTTRGSMSSSTTR